MFATVEIPLWLLLLILAFAAASFLSHFLFPSVRWFFRRRAERLVQRLNRRLAVPIRPFKLMRRHDMIQRLVHDPEVMAAVVEHARETGVPEAVALEQARHYAREIVPGFSANLYFTFALRLARWLSHLLFRVRVQQAAPEALRAIGPDSTVVFVMNHRSNMDYVLVTYLVGGRSALAYAVGEWANVWPLNALIRAMGGYFIRRRDLSPLYRRVLARYVRLATDAGIAQAMFPEGGLSLTGEVQPPKLGLFKYLVDGRQDGAPDIVFVPVALNYDRILEDRVLIEAARTGERRFRARLSSMAVFTGRVIWRMARGRFRRFGTAAVAFGPPVRLSELPADDVAALGREVMRRIRAAMPLVPVAVAAEILRAGGAMTRADFTERFASRLAAPGDPAEAARHAAVDAEYALDIMTRRGMVRQRGQIVEPVAAERPLLDFYAASVAHLSR